MVLTPHMLKRTCAAVMQKAKKLKGVNGIYNNVTTPITLVELSFDDVPDMIPYHKVIQDTFTNVPQFIGVVSCYDAFAIDKDMIESIVSVSLNLRKFVKLSDKNKVLFICKTLCLVYKTIIYNTNLHAYHNAALVCLDYLNFVISCIE